MNQRRSSVVAVGVFLVASCSRHPDVEKYCHKVSSCESESEARCVSETREHLTKSRERGCGDESAAVITCKIQHAHCEHSGGLPVLSGGKACADVLDAELACFRRADDARADNVQTFDEAMKIVCGLPSRPGITSLPQDQRAAAIAREMNRDVTNPEVKAYFSSTAPVPAEQRERELRAMLARANITSCWLVDPK